ncbi:hypothetical protein AJ79_01728 [Helicocarpus griseus UAMH5409]|uniref:HNH nuclease domain-containing protein n=1 Tax=Helicocarpus griseus UAMH5409 TaxID=1447875 RepID=A0A2B7Y713_9EURO|nr:hypothetical protein AJ79_01728 [Helicocarpus griseus UAMH5409]
MLIIAVLLFKKFSYTQDANRYNLVIVNLTDEKALVRAVSKLPSATAHVAFENSVRQRDQGCVVVKEEQGDSLVKAGIWTGFDAAHVFPVAYSALWPTLGFNSIGISGSNEDNVNSVQNGILLRADIHQLFDTYFFSICAKSNHKIVYFMPDVNNIAGTHLSQEFISNPRRPPDELLDWHFRQAVLANVKAEGEPVFEHDFNTGENMIGQIRQGPQPQQRMEFELFMRLAHLQPEVPGNAPSHP